jgi:hypothetical protein
MERVKSWEVITDSGMEIQSFWQKSFIDFPIDIFFTGIPSLAGFASTDQRFGLLKTYLTQELLSRGFLASNMIYSSIAHTASDRNAYFDVFSTVLENAKAATIDGSLEKRLHGPTSHVGFKRLN